MVRVAAVLSAFLVLACSPAPIVMGVSEADEGFKRDHGECTRWAETLVEGQSNYPPIVARAIEDKKFKHSIARLSPNYDPATFAVGAAIGQGINAASYDDAMVKLMTGYCLEERGYTIENRDAVGLGIPFNFCNVVLRQWEEDDVFKRCMEKVEDRNRRLGYIN